MPRRHQVRRVAKWIGYATCAVIAVNALVSLQWRFGVVRDDWAVLVQRSGVCFDWWWHLAGHAQMVRDEVWYPTGAFAYRDTGRTLLADMLQQFTPAVIIPHWILFAIAVVPTVYLRWRYRRPPRGHCQSCGYDLTGNVSGRCPECGSAVLSDTSERTE